MFESKLKENRRYYLEINKERYRFSTRSLAIISGKGIRSLGIRDVKLIEEYDLFSWEGGNHWEHIDHQEFDRTVLLDLPHEDQRRKH